MGRGRPATVLTRLGITRAAPSQRTIPRLLQQPNADALDAGLGAWMRLRATAIGAVTVISLQRQDSPRRPRRSRRADAPAGRICQATGVILAQIAVDGRTSEVPVLRKLLSRLTIAGCVITADAAHTCRETAQQIIDAGTHYILTIKADQPL